MSEALDTASAADAARTALAAADGGGAVAVVLALDGGGAGRRLLRLENGECRGSLGDEALDALALDLAAAALAGGKPALHTVALAAGPVRLFVEAFRPPEELLIVGAGHIAVPLANLGVTLGYRVTVLDDREDFATAERFPTAAAVLRTDFEDLFREVAIGHRTHVVLVTRAHRYDYDCLRRLLEEDSPAAYIGVIGSRRRIRAAFQALLDAGISRDRVRRVRAPIGLEIGAETPEEIAVSIAAELIQLRRAGGKRRATGATNATNPVDPPLADPDASDDAGSADRSPRPIWATERVLDRLLPEKEATHG